MKYLVEKCKYDPMHRDVMWNNTPLALGRALCEPGSCENLVEDCNCDVMCRKSTPLHDATLGGNLEAGETLAAKNVMNAFIG